MSARRRPEVALAVRAAAGILLVEAGLRVLSLPRLTRMLGVSLEPAGGEGSRVPARHVAREERVVDALLRRWPVRRGRCLRRALLLGFLVRRERPRLVIGVSRRNEALRAHAWIEVSGATSGDPGDFRPLRHRRHTT